LPKGRADDKLTRGNGGKRRGVTHHGTGTGKSCSTGGFKKRRRNFRRVVKRGLTKPGREEKREVLMREGSINPYPKFWGHMRFFGGGGGKQL